MGCVSFLQSPRKEEREVPDSNVTGTKEEIAYITHSEIDEAMDGFESIFGVENEDNKILSENKSVYGNLSWDFMEWGGSFHINIADDGADQEGEQEEVYSDIKVIKTEDNAELCHEDQKRLRLNLNLNYQQVLDEWCDRGPLWADEFSLSLPSGGYYMGEVPVMEEERSRRGASVLRYKEKRQSRLFSKKIRYQVRKLNADKRPRLKGRFVKRVPS